MVVYEVNLQVVEPIRDEFAVWLKSHIDQMLKIEGFLSARLFTDTENPCNFCVQYELRDQEALNHYIQTHAAGMRAEGLARFPNQFSAHRRILSELA